jgi:DMSO/TMAO reductase YedYZ heme-binding membrane subunit
LGLAALLSLAALTGLGLWLHHPWRESMKGVRPITWLRAHSALAATTVTLVVAHLTAIALDRYARVGWTGALVPWRSAYRPSPVALGTLALWLMILVGASAGLAGIIGGGRWLAVHRLAWLSFAAAWLHGVTAGSDTERLRLVYLLTGVFVAGLAATRSWAVRQRTDERFA